MSELFHYSLIQYRGDPARHEALNVGVAVVGASGHARVLIDRSASSRVADIWPNFNRSLFYAFARDLRHQLSDVHQLLLGESESLSGSLASLEALAEFSSNQFGLTSPRPYMAGTLEEAATKLYRRMVNDARRPSRNDRHMRRAALRGLIAEVLATWARSQATSLTLEPSAQIDGLVTSHVADLVAFENSSPRLVFFATPLVGPTAPLVRDALPTVVRDLRKRHEGAEFFAVLGDSNVDLNDPMNPAVVARAILAEVPQLTVLGLEELRDKFALQAPAVA